MAFDVINRKTFGCQNCDEAFIHRRPPRSMRDRDRPYRGWSAVNCGGGRLTALHLLQTQAVALAEMPTLNTDSTTLIPTRPKLSGSTAALLLAISLPRPRW